jgi:branched-chain amino acid transport system permease protein
VLIQLANGLIVGLLYALMAVGVTFVFGVMKIINFAHGEFFMLGGYVFYFLQTLFGIPIFLAVGATVLLLMLVGMLADRILLRQMYARKMDDPESYGLIVTFGISMFLQNFALAAWGIYYKSPLPIMVGTVSFGFLQFSLDRIVCSLIGLCSLIIVLVLVQDTWTGKALRATAQNREGAELVGIDTLRMNTLAFGIGAALAGLAGALLSYTYLVYPLSGSLPFLIGLTIVVLGGLGSIKGSLIGAIIIGVFQSVMVAFAAPEYSEVWVFLIMVIILLIRPQGLFGQKLRLT